LTNPGLALLGIKQWLKNLGDWLVAFGPLGLFAISLIDSAGLPLPGGPDTVMILLSAERHALMPLYAVAASIGSTIGCTMMYWVARRAGILALRRMKPSRRERIENLLGRYDMFAIVVTAILPPPFPFKPFVLSAGAFKLKLWRFVTAVFIGRMVRFMIEGWLAIVFGKEAGDVIKQHGLKVLAVVLGAAAALMVFNIIRSRRRSQQLRAEPPLDNAPSSEGQEA
jgi:membrane protein DedA with SNARE-associated domain